MRVVVVNAMAVWLGSNPIKAWRDIGGRSMSTSLRILSNKCDTARLAPSCKAHKLYWTIKKRGQ